MLKSKNNVAVGRHVVNVVSPIGQGGHSSIFLVKDTTTGEEMVLKKTTPLIQAQMDMAQREVALNRQLKHPNIAKYKGDSIHEYRRSGKKVYDVYLLLEHCPGGHLLDLVNNRREAGNPLSEGEALRYFVQVCRAVDYLHRHKPPVAHRDIKLENVLLATGGRVKLCDFGSCHTKRVVCKTKEDRVREEETIERYTTPFYRAPEMCDLYSGKIISEKVDIWALGCMLFALLFGRHAFEDGGKLGILNGVYTVPSDSGVSEEAIALIKWMLNTHPDKRPQVGDVLDYVEELTGTSTGQAASKRGSGVGARPPAPGEEPTSDDDSDVDDEGTGRDDDDRVSETKAGKQPSPRHSKLTTLRAGNKPKQTNPEQAGAAAVAAAASAGRNRAPSAALKARMARRARSSTTSSSSSTLVNVPNGNSTTSIANNNNNHNHNSSTIAGDTVADATAAIESLNPFDSSTESHVTDSAASGSAGESVAGRGNANVFDVFASNNSNNNNASVPSGMAPPIAPVPLSAQSAARQFSQPQQQQHAQLQQQVMYLQQQQQQQQAQWQQMQPMHHPHQPLPGKCMTQPPMPVMMDSRTRIPSNPFDAAPPTSGSLTPALQQQQQQLYHQGQQMAMQNQQFQQQQHQHQQHAQMTPSQMPLFYSNPGLASSSFSGFPVQPTPDEQHALVSESPQFFSNPGLQ